MLVNGKFVIPTINTIYTCISLNNEKFSGSGIHHDKKNCESSKVLLKIQLVLRIAKKFRQLFPSRLRLTTVKKEIKIKIGNGGWGDHRDHSLCRNMIQF